MVPSPVQLPVPWVISKQCPSKAAAALGVQFSLALGGIPGEPLLEPALPCCPEFNKHLISFIVLLPAADSRVLQRDRCQGTKEWVKRW